MTRTVKRRLLGIGPVPAALDGGRVVVRQPAALATGALLAVVMAAMTVAVLIEPGQTGSTGSAFLDRWVFGVLVVPIVYFGRRFFLRPRIVVDQTGVKLVNAFSGCTLTWPQISNARGGTAIEIVAADGDCARAMVYGPSFSGPFTSDARPAEVVALVRAESARRAGREPLPEDYAATELVAGPDGAGWQTALDAPDLVVTRPALGLPEAAAYLLAWTLACAVAAALA